MRKSLIKIVSLLLIIGLSWAGLLSIGQTHAFFFDNVDSNNNIFTAGTLALTLRSGQGNFIPPETAGNMSPGQSVTRDIYIKKEGSLSFRYNAHSVPVLDNCDSEFYNLLGLKVWYNWYDNTGKHMDLKYDGLLKDFDLRKLNPNDPDLEIPNSHSYFNNTFYEPDEHWLYFQITYPSEAEEKSEKSCQFKFVFNGWQTNLPDSSSGFSDTEEIYSTLTDSIFVEEEPIINNSDIVINEFLPNAVNYPEFIEIYNKSTSSIDLKGFYIKINDSTIPINATTTARYSNGSTTIDSYSWLVVTSGGNVMNDATGTVALYNPNDIKIDSISYPLPTSTSVNSTATPGAQNATTSEALPDKSFARIPDGSSTWYDPIPTPGAPNKLSEEEEMELGLISPTTTTTTTTIPEEPTTTTTTTEPPEETTTTTTIPDNASTTTSTTTTTTTTEPPEETTTTTTTEPTTSNGENTTATTTTTTTTTTTIPPTTTTTTIPEETTTTTTTTTEPTTSNGENTTATTTTTTTTTTTIPPTTTTTTIPEEPTTTTTTTEPPEETTTTTTTIPEETTTTTIPPTTTTTTTEPATSRINICFV